MMIPVIFNNRMKITDNTERLETIGCFIDIFEDFLKEKGVSLDSSERDQDEDAAIIYGSDYDALSNQIETLLTCLGLLG